jgi:Na+(H+)/acetate symporter ActP
MNMVEHPHASIEMIVHQLSLLEAAVTKMAESVSRLAIMEERQMADRQAVERAFKEIADIKKQQAEHEKMIILNARTSAWVERAVWAAACAAVLAVAAGKHII